jgi:DNA-binding NarL/FixJ family response regulator
MAAAVHNSAWQGILSPREAEVLSLLADGWSNRQIGREMFVSEQTVKFHVTGIYTALGLGRRYGAAQQARVSAARWWIENVELPARSAAA